MTLHIEEIQRVSTKYQNVDLDRLRQLSDREAGIYRMVLEVYSRTPSKQNHQSKRTGARA